MKLKVKLDIIEMDLFDRIILGRGPGKCYPQGKLSLY